MPRMILYKNPSKEVLKSCSFDFDAKEFIVKDGSPVLVDNLEATKQWIQKFLFWF